jgi:hypothetical protein
MLRFTEGYYHATLDDDAKRWGLKLVDPKQLAQPFSYSNELDTPRRLKADKDQLDTARVHLATHVIKEWAGDSGQGFRYEHMILEITNKTDHALAYRVETAVDHPEKCKSQGAILHNAIALKPGETLRRTECLWRPGAMLTVKRVETLEVPELSYYYVSRLVPTQILLEERTALGHEQQKVKPCQFVPWRDIAASAKSSGTEWADVLDFYARHNCDEYTFWRGYRRWTEAGTLPSRAPAGTPAPASAEPDGGAAPR